MNKHAAVWIDPSVKDQRGITMKPLDELKDDELRACVISPNYPLVECSHPGDSLPGYIVCVHVIAGAVGVNVQHADRSKAGKVTCDACVHSTRLSELRTACAHYVRDHFAVAL